MLLWANAKQLLNAINNYDIFKKKLYKCYIILLDWNAL